LIGNLIDFPKEAPWIAYADMSKEYGRRNISIFSRRQFAATETRVQGDVVCLRAFSQVVVVLCSLTAMKDLLEKRGEIYSDRPSLPIAEMYEL
jgi:hypothetical protein